MGYVDNCYTHHPWPTDDSRARMLLNTNASPNRTLSRRQDQLADMSGSLWPLPYPGGSQPSVHPSGDARRRCRSPTLSTQGCSCNTAWTAPSYVHGASASTKDGSTGIAVSPESLVTSLEEWAVLQSQIDESVHQSIEQQEYLPASPRARKDMEEQIRRDFLRRRQNAMVRGQF